MSKDDNSTMNTKRYLCIDCAGREGYSLSGMRFTLATCTQCHEQGIAALESHYQTKTAVVA